MVVVQSNCVISNEILVFTFFDFLPSYSLINYTLSSIGVDLFMPVILTHISDILPNPSSSKVVLSVSLNNLLSQVSRSFYHSFDIFNFPINSTIQRFSAALHQTPRVLAVFFLTKFISERGDIN